MKTNNNRKVKKLPAENIKYRHNLVLLDKEEYNYNVRDFNKKNGGRPITPDAIVRDLQSYANSNRANNTIRFRKYCLTAAFYRTYADREDDLQWEYESKRKFKKFKLGPIRFSVDRKDIPEPSEVYSFISSQEVPLTWRLMGFHLYYVGPRISEALSIRLVKCEIKGENVYYKLRGKGNKERIVYWPLWLHAKIVKAFNSEVYLYQSPINKNQPYSSSWVGKNFRRYTKLVLGHGYSPHKFRHSFATTMLESGVSLKAISEWLGHSTIATTGDMYTHVRMTDEDFKKFDRNISTKGLFKK